MVIDKEFLVTVTPVTEVVLEELFEVELSFLQENPKAIILTIST
jgi:hypothetical protein